MKIEKIYRKIMYFMLAAIMCLSVAAVGVSFSKANEIGRAHV